MSNATVDNGLTKMSMAEYQEWEKKNAFFEGSDVSYPALGLCGESGEFADKVKKSQRDDGGRITDERRRDMLLELGDVLFYLAMAADRLGSTLDEVARMNMEKVDGRNARGTRRGSGDNR